MELLEKELGHTFLDRALLVHALTHRSLSNEQAADPHQELIPGAGDNERLEFLGDAVVGLVVAEALFSTHPEWHEGELTRVRAQLVSRKHMAEVAHQVGLQFHLRLSRSEERGGLRYKSTILSNTMEAVIGALFLDGGLDPVRAFVAKHVLGEVDRLASELRSGEALGNYKSALQEYLQKIGEERPEYYLRGESGPDHRKRFTIEVRFKSQQDGSTRAIARGVGSTKKIAEQDAARRALERLNLGEMNIAASAADPGDEEPPPA